MNLPIPLAGEEILDVLDSTKLNNFQDCNRRFFFEYVLGWRRSRPNVHLSFGSAWHEAMEALMQTRNGQRVGYGPEDITRAYDAFERTWDSIYGNPDNEGLMIIGADNEPTIQLDSVDGKNKGNAAVALLDYAKTFRGDRFRTLFTEVSGATPISEDQLIYFKLDTIIEDTDGIWSYEHKTTGRKTNNWGEKWEITLQIGTYLHVLSQYYGDQASGVMVNGAVLRKEKANGQSNNEFLRMPVRRQRDMASLWLWEMRHLVQQMEWNFRMLEKCSPGDRIMQAFPRNPASCTKFGCGFPELCPRVANPLQHCNHPPFGYKVDVWDPRNRGGDDDGTPIILIPNESPKVRIEGEGGLVIEATPGPS